MTIGVRAPSAAARSNAEAFGKTSFDVIAARVLMTVSVLASSLITARWLGPHGRGQYSVAILTGAIVALLFDGFSSGALYYSARGGFPRRRIVGSALTLGFLNGLAACLLCLSLLPLRGDLLGAVPVEYLVIALSGVPFGLLLTNALALMRGFGDFRGYNLALVGQFAIPLAITAVALIGLGAGPGAAVAAMFTGTATVAVAAAFRCRRLAGGVELRDVAYAKKAGSYGLRAQLGNVLTYLGYRIDVLLVNGYMNAAAAGFYSVALATAERAQAVAEAAATVLQPKIAGELDSDRQARLTPVVARTVLWMTVVLALALAALAHWLVVLLYSGEFEPAVRPTEILLLSMIPAAVQRVLSADISGRGRPLLNTLVAGASLPVNVGLNVVLIPRYGISGAAWSSVASYSLAAALTCAIYLRISRNSLASIVVPRRRDLVLLWSIFASLIGRRRRAVPAYERSPRVVDAEGG